MVGKVIGHEEFAFSDGGFLLGEEPLLEQALLPHDIKAALQLLGRSAATRTRSGRLCTRYPLHEPPELYSRRDDLRELHNLAGVPERAGVRKRAGANVPADHDG
ncbi:hypothetical protein INS49_005933 [Diaporthe citri]|uniref:uncharacterized protein n=1 Tax=Diaporthe citri TaxID=83186 RepID=UPI001C820904|nr:uncharacterized protein INS49_005933 [Diaporthe citri]KAG6364332.1 hypothetical protein INS49_005933 [Diaporthe citri]